MVRRLLTISAFICLFLLAGCFQIVPSDVTSVAAEKANPTNTPEPQIVYVTATPNEPIVIVVTNTPEPATATPQVVDSITITNLVDNGGGQATIGWNATGSFPSGFEIVWSDVNQIPTFLSDTSSYVTDSNARSAVINAQAGKIYFIRVCRYVDNSCDLYSNVAYFAMNNPTVTPFTPTSTPNISYVWSTSSITRTPTSTTTAATPSIFITSIRSAGNGAATIYWRAYGSFSDGFKILYSKDASQPTYGDYSLYSIDDGDTRSASVSGDFGTKYYFRICRYTGSSCDSYSNTYSYTFSGPPLTPSGTLEFPPRKPNQLPPP